MFHLTFLPQSKIETAPRISVSFQLAKRSPLRESAGYYAVKIDGFTLNLRQTLKLRPDFKI